MWFKGPSAAYGKPRSGGPGQGNLLGMYRPDGISDGANTVQGVRTVDASSSSWTTPDAFAGVIGEPARQKSYIWNRNNPVNYADPTVYNATYQGLDGSGSEDSESDWNIAYTTGDSDPTTTADRLTEDPGWSAVDLAALDATRTFHDKELATKSEWGGRIVCDLARLSCGWTLSPDSGNHLSRECGSPGCSVLVLEAKVPPGTHTAAAWHDHWNKDGVEMFSSGDFEFSIVNHIPDYVGTPSGNLLRTTGFNAAGAWHETGKSILLCQGCVQ